ncbi:MAG: hypothetical protein AAF648_17445 [Pseudomonadota bacterium]
MIDRRESQLIALEHPNRGGRRAALLVGPTAAATPARPIFPVLPGVSRLSSVSRLRSA